MQYRRRFSGFRRSVSAAWCMALAGVAAGLGTLSVSTDAAAQAATFPFPSTNVQAAGGRFTTRVLTPHELRAQYTAWVQRFVERCGQGDARVRYPESGNDTRSEGVGYGMVIAAYMGDKPTFDGLWDYYQRSSPGTGLMHWRRTGCDAGGGGADTGSASDADIDAAFGLIVANKQWPGQGYAADATRVVGAIRTNLFQGGCQGILLAGSQFAACGCINPSYIPPGYYPAFGASDQAAFWTTARTNSYTYFNAVNNDQTGLVPAWSQSNGSLNLACNGQPQVSGGGATNQFQADAARTPWRVATDFIWTGNASAAAFLRTIAGFANNQRIVQIVDVYDLNGTPRAGTGTGANLDATGFRSTFTMGGFATAMTASSQVDVDEFTGAWQSMYIPGDSVGPNGAAAPRAFNASLALLYGLTVTGYMWDPTGANPTPVAAPTLAPQGTNLIENGDFDEGFLNWTMENIGGTASEGFAMHQAGELHLRNQRVSGVTGNQWHVRLSQSVAVQANQRYRISVRARADEPRLLRLIVAQKNTPFATYMALDDDPMLAGAAFTVGPEMTTYEIVAQTALADADARFAFELADDVAGLVIDDVVFEPTTEPLHGLVDPMTGEPVTPVPGEDTTDPNTPGGGGGGNIGTAGSGNLGTIPNQGDNPGGPVQPVGSNADNVTGGNAPPPAPGGRPVGDGRCTVMGDPACGTFACSVQLGLCYEPTYGYVWDSTAANGAGGWTLPPRGPCLDPYVFWPLVNGCYDPASGYAFNPMTNAWQYIGDWYTADDGSDDKAEETGCAVSGSAPTGDASHLMLSGLMAAALGLAFRRRR